MNFQKGFSTLEAIIAAALFVIFVSGVSGLLIQSYNSNRQAEEYMSANNFAAEGIEALKSISNQAYANLQNRTSAGVQVSGGVWTLQAESINNPFDKYTRAIKIESVNRDGTGNIVTAPAGTLDPNTKKVTSTVTWNFTESKPLSYFLSSYLTNWRAAISSVGDAIMIYLDNTSTSTDDQPEYRTYTNSTNTFGGETNMTTSFTEGTADPRTFKIKTSPIKTEAIAGYVTSTGVLRILCFDGTTWTSEWTTTVGGTGTNSFRFDISYEQTTGDALVVYSRNVATTNEMGYRTKQGSIDCGTSNWISEAPLNPIRTSAVIQIIRLRTSHQSGSNNIGLAWGDTARDLSAMVWDGSSFSAEPASVLETELEYVTATTLDAYSFDLAFESLSGNLMIIWGEGPCSAGTCMQYIRYISSWGTPGGVPTIADLSSNLDISSNPLTNEMVAASIDNSSGDLSIAYWSGSTWTVTPNADQTVITPASGNELVATGWLLAGASCPPTCTTRSIVLFVNSGTQSQRIHGFVGNGSTFTRQGTETTPWFTPTPLFANPPRWLDIQVDPKNEDTLMLTVSDNNSDLFTKRLVMTSTPTFTWTNADGGTALETALGQATTLPFGFAYWRNP